MLSIHGVIHQHSLTTPHHFAALLHPIMPSVNHSQNIQICVETVKMGCCLRCHLHDCSRSHSHQPHWSRYWLASRHECHLDSLLFIDDWVVDIQDSQRQTCVVDDITISIVLEWTTEDICSYCHNSQYAHYCLAHCCSYASCCSDGNCCDISGCLLTL